MGSLKDALETSSDEELKAALEKTSTTIQQLTLTLLVLAVFAVAVAGTPDIALVLPDSAISVPTLGGMPIGVALILGPLVLIAVRTYLERYVIHWRALNSEMGRRDLMRPLTISPMRDDFLKWATWGVRCMLVPAAMTIITWKALGEPRPVRAHIFGVWFTLGVGHGLALATFSITLLPVRWWTLLPTLGLTAIAVFLFPQPGQRYLPQRIQATVPDSVYLLHRPLDLRYADLSRRVLNGYDLRKADLTRAILAKSQLNGSTLFNANLFRADLTSAELDGVDLRHAELLGANLTNAGLNSADLTNAYLVYADLTNADLNFADLTDAILNNADLTGTDLRHAPSLTCEQLTTAVNWQQAYRDPELACGAPIPTHPDDVGDADISTTLSASDPISE